MRYQCLASLVLCAAAAMHMAMHADAAGANDTAESGGKPKSRRRNRTDARNNPDGLNAPGFPFKDLKPYIERMKKRKLKVTNAASGDLDAGDLDDDQDSKEDVFYDAEAELHGVDIVIEAVSNQEGDLVLTCPPGYSISILDASALCNHHHTDFRLEAWEICRTRDTCVIRYDNIGHCSSGWTGLKLRAVCTKVRGFDCFLFRAVHIMDKEFCKHVCMEFSKRCKRSDMPVTRGQRLECLTSLFEANNLNSRCTYLFDGMTGKQAEINKEGSGYRQYDIGIVMASNVVWTEVNFRKPMDDPVVFTSVPHADGNYIYMSITDVTSSGFKVLSREWICDLACITLSTEQKRTVQWLAINRGDHSQNLDDIIGAGVLRVNNNIENINLPIDPKRSWSVLVQVQERPLGLSDMADILKPNMAIPVLYDQREGFHVKLMYTNDMGKEHFVKLGYLAIQINETNDLYGLFVKSFIDSMDNPEYADIVLSIPPAWPYPAHAFAQTRMWPRHRAAALRSEVCSLRMKATVQDMTGVDNVSTYNFRIDFNLEYLTGSAGRSNPRIGGFTIQDFPSAILEKICRFAKKINSRSTSQRCFDFCMGPQGLSSCLDAENMALCFENKRNHCVLQAPHLDLLLDEYGGYVRHHRKDVPLAVAEADDSRGDRISRNPGTSDRDSRDSTDSYVEPDTPSEKEEEMVLERDCIEGPWGEWSSCSNHCYSDTVKAKQRRRRQIYADRLGGNSRPCVLVDSRDCEDVPPCSDFCYSREGSGDESTFQQKFYYIWSPKCRNPNTTYINEKETFGYTGGSQFDTVGVTRVGIPSLLPRSPGSASSNLGDAASGGDRQCGDENNWSKCNAPCYLATRDQAIEYLRAPIKCLDHRRPCTTKLADCPTEESLRAVEEFGSCVLTHAFYDASAQSWTRDGACVCEDGVACTPEEVYVLGDTSELISTGSDTHLEHVVRASPFHPYISLADNHRIEMPAELVRDVTYGLFEPGEVANFCTTGSPEIPAFDHKLMWIDCNLAMSAQYGRDPLCQVRCAQLRETCEREIPRDAPETIGECVKARIVDAKSNIYVLNFKHHSCTEPLVGPGITNEDQVCDVKSWLESTTQLCVLLCRRIFNMCKIKSLHAYEEKVRSCMLHHAQLNDVAMRDGTPVDFNKLCIYHHTKLVGGGLVYCKKRKIVCTSEGWEPWSDCSASCITLNEGTPVVPTRQRKRKQKILTPTEYAHCLMKGVKFHEEVPCLWLPQCPDDPSIQAAIAQTRARVAWDVAFDTPWNLQSWLMKDAREDDKEVTEDHMCQLYSGQRDISNNKIIYQKSRCSCPPQMRACTVLESVHSSGWFSMLQLLCQEDSMRSVLFKQSKGYYRYSCLSRTFVREDFEAHKELCNEGDGTSFVSCQGPAHSTHVYIFAVLSLVMGALTAALIFTYTRSRSSFV
ncbi:microneme MIC14 [Babesia ovata]|uniref:Microneme MIC14 n=1 Tax=Babesia ovata TaxID=189622 RepID=A0A2H6KCR2_9APIC|nr:microneme MIC14 [Babesia ovata]GBE60764.1 microneme MIC14 [Babesia ovata]